MDRETGLICDQTIALNGFYATKHYPGHLRRIRYRDPDTGKNLVFLTNQFALPTGAIRPHGGRQIFGRCWKSHFNTLRAGIL